MQGRKREIESIDSSTKEYTFPGLIDLQVNGAFGVDFNDVTLQKKDVLRATEYLLTRGVTTYFPTIITHSPDDITRLLATLVEACDSYPVVRETVAGFHLEGPFISPKEGAKGAHHASYIIPPDWEMFKKFQKAAKGKIRLVTIAPEWEGSCDFIERCQKEKVMVSMGHSLANAHQISKAVEAGLLFSTHLGNGVPPKLDRHPNVLWEQLANDHLIAMVIADGLHLPDSFLKVVKRVKNENMILVSDMTCFAGLPPGEYKTFIGGNVILDKERKLSLNDGSGLLAGAAKDLTECIETLISHKLATPEEAWEMASSRVDRILEKYSSKTIGKRSDRVSVKFTSTGIKVLKTIKKIENKWITYEGENG